MDTTGRPATMPAKATVPAAALRICVPSAAARSTPRCPRPHTTAGGSKPSTTVAGAPVGHWKRPRGRRGSAGRSVSAWPAVPVSLTSREGGLRLVTREVDEVSQWAASAGSGALPVRSGSNGSWTHGAGTVLVVVLVAGLVPVLIPRAGGVPGSAASEPQATSAVASAARRRGGMWEGEDGV